MPYVLTKKGKAEYDENLRSFKSKARMRLKELETGVLALKIDESDIGYLNEYLNEAVSLLNGLRVPNVKGAKSPKSLWVEHTSDAYSVSDSALSFLDEFERRVSEDSDEQRKAIQFILNYTIDLLNTIVELTGMDLARDTEILHEYLKLPD